jgi:chromatin remodeling complex protein RSC6
MLLVCRLDAVISKKRRLLAEEIKLAQPEEQTLRLFVGHSYDRSQQTPTWTLTVEGRLLACDKPVKLGRFFSKIEVNLDKKLYPNDEHAQWSAHDKDADLNCEGFRVTRSGDRSSLIRVQLTQSYPAGQQKFQLSPILRQVLSHSPVTITAQHATLHDVLQSTWKYIRSRQLQDSETRTFVQCDAMLQALFGCDHFSFYELRALLERHLTSPEPVAFDYRMPGFEEAPKASGQYGDRELTLDLKVQAYTYLHAQKKQALLASVKAADSYLGTEAQRAAHLGEWWMSRAESHARKEQLCKLIVADPLRAMGDLIASQVMPPRRAHFNWWGPC